MLHSRVLHYCVAIAAVAATRSGCSVEPDIYSDDHRVFPNIPRILSLGGDSDHGLRLLGDIYRAIDVGENGDVFAVGSLRYLSRSISPEIVRESHAEQDMVISKFDKEGRLKWSRSLGASRYDQAFNICSRGNFLYVVGVHISRSLFEEFPSTSSSNPGGEFSRQGYIVRIEKEHGKTIWAKTAGRYLLGEMSAGAQVFTSIKAVNILSECVIDDSGSVLASGSLGRSAGASGIEFGLNNDSTHQAVSGLDGVILSYTSDGTLKWVLRTLSRTDTASNRFRAHMVAPDGGEDWFAGRFEGLSAGSIYRGPREAFVGKVSPRGEWMWAKRVGRQGGDGN